MGKKIKKIIKKSVSKLTMALILMGTIVFAAHNGTPPKTFSDGEILTHTDLNNLFNELYSTAWERVGTTNKIYYNRGFVGIGTDNPSTKLHLYNTSSTYLRLETSGSTNEYVRMFLKNPSQEWSPAVAPNGDYRVIDSTSNTAPFVITAGAPWHTLFIANSGNVGIGTNYTGSYKLYVNGTLYTSGGCTGCSDARWKKNVRHLTCALDTIEKLQGVNFEWKVKKYPKMFFKKGNQIGLVAQDVEKVLPELVYEDKGYKFLRYEKLTPLLLEAIKELKAEKDREIREKDSRIKGLENKVKSLEARLSALERRLGR